ncbi:hypothetical protein ACFQ6U_13725 [Streptomyces sp. NPDC056465]|uniref:hypothetical protein n=1 Tax=Streptomyces sp. NPDC056465 TaxID=3345829 RepID=UPI0036AA7EAE
MLNRPAAEHAELQDLSADLELKAARRKWNPALHPRDSKGRFIETGGTVRLWGGKLARVVRALPNDRILVQDQTGPGNFGGRRHTTSAKWVSMVARPDGSAPTEDEDKVVAEDERRKKDPVRGNGVARDDDGDPSTPNNPHDRDDQGRPIGEDDGDGPGDDDDEDEPADGNHPINTAALPNRRHAAGSRFKDTATVRQHFTQLADRPGQKPDMVRFLRSVAGDDDLQTNRSGRLAILRDDATGRWYLTATGTGQRMDGAGDFATAREAARFADHLDSNVRANGEGGAPFDFSDPDLDHAARAWTSSNGENVQAAIIRARADFDTAPTAAAPKDRSTDSSSGTGGAQRFATLDAVRAHWTAGPDTVRGGDDSERSRSVQARNGEIAARKLTRAQLSPAGHFVLVRRGNAWDLHHAGTSLQVAHGFKTKPQAMQAARDLEAVSDDNGQPLDWSAPGTFNANTTGAGKTARDKAQADADASTRPNRPAPAADPTLAPPAQGDSQTDADRSAVSTGDLEAGDRVKFTVGRSGIEWPSSTRDREKPDTAIVEGTIAPGYQGRGTWMPLVDTTLTDENGDAIASGESVNIMSPPATVTVTERGNVGAPERVRADRIRVGDVIVNGGFGQVVTGIRRFEGGRSFNVRSLGPGRAADGFSTKLDDEQMVIPKARRRPEDVQRDAPGHTGRHIDRAEAGRAARNILSNWQEINDLAAAQWPDGAPAEFRALVQNMQNVRDSPKGADGYQKNAQAMHDALTALHDLDTDSLNYKLRDALHGLEERLDANADRFAADARAITENNQKKEGAAKAQQRLEELRSRPGVADLDDDQLRAEYDELIAADFRDIGPDAQALLEKRLEDVKRERRDRDKRALTERPDVSKLFPSELRAERRELERARTSYESDEVAEARKERIAAIDAEEERRKNTPPPTAPSTPASDEPDEPLQEAWDKPELFVTLTMPEAMYVYLNEEGTAPLEDPDTRKALYEAARGRGGTVKVKAPLAVHEALLQYADVLAGGDDADAEPNEIRAYANYAKRIGDAAEELRNRPTAPSDAVDGPNVPGEGDDTGTVTLSPDEVSAQLDPVRPEGSKAPSAMTNSEISAEMVALVEREMANGGLSGVDRTRLQVLEAEEARRAGRAPKRDEAKPKPQPDEAGGLFDVDGPATPQRQAADFANPDDRPADAFGTPDMFADAEGRDTTSLREPQMRTPMDLQAGDRFVDASGRTHTVAKAPVRTGRGRVLVTSDDGREHLLAPDTALRVLYPDETAPETDTANTPDADAPAPEEGMPSPDVPDAGAPNGDDLIDSAAQTEGEPQQSSGDTVDEASIALAVSESLPELPKLPNLTGQSRQNKDDIRRIRGDYARIRQSIEGILAGNPPTGDGREDLRRIREQLDYVAGRLTQDLVRDSYTRESVRGRLVDLSRFMDQRLAALPDRSPQPLGDGPNGGTLFHPWDLRDGDLVRFDAENQADRDRSLAPYYGTFRGRSSSAAGEQGRTLVSYEGLTWNDDRQQWENQGMRHTVTMPPRGLVERFTPEQWDTWRRPEQSDGDQETTDNTTAPEAPIRDVRPVDMTDEDIEAELEELQAWQNRHVRSSGEGPRIQGNVMIALSPVASRRGHLHDEQRNRSNARREKERLEEQKRVRAAALARAEIGKRNADGSYPVAIDGQSDAGTVRQLGRQWMYAHASGTESGLEHGSRAEAVAGLVRIHDIRRQDADDAARRDQASRETPDGWVFGDRDDVAENDIIRVPRTKNLRGEQVFVGWGNPVRVTDVEHRADGATAVRYRNVDGSYTWGGPLVLRGPEDTFAWAEDRTRPEPTPEWHHELRLRMADIGDDIATLNRLEGFEEPERIQRLAELIRRVEEHKSDDLQADLERILDETAWLEGQFGNPDLPYETRSCKSWAVAARMKAEWALDEFKDKGYGPSAPPSYDDPARTDGDDRSARMAGLLGEASNAIGGDSLPEIGELRDRVDGAGDTDDPDSELRDVADRLDALADQYALAGPQGEHAADRFRSAARIGRGERDDENGSGDTETGDRPSNDDSSSPAQGEGTPNDDGDQQEDTDEESRQPRSGNADGGAADPGSGPDGESAGTAETPRNGGGSSGGANNSDVEQNGPDDEDREEQRGRRRRNRGRGAGGAGGSGLGGLGGGGLGGPRLPHLNLPDLDNDDNDRTRRHADADSLRRAWRAGEGLDPAEDTPERRALLAQAADREGLVLSLNGGLVAWPEPQDDGSTLWRFAQSRNGTNLPRITLTADSPEMAQELAGRFEGITDGNGDLFDWHQAWGPSRVAQWRDGEGRNLPRALRAVQDDYEQERIGAFTLPEDLTGLDDTELEAAFRRGLGPEDELRMMAEMDRRDGLVDERIRAAVPDTPPADADEAERRGRAMDEALGFGGADVTRPAPATPGSLRREFDALDEERFQAAMAATGGRLFNPESEDSGVDPRDLFSGRKVTAARAQELASDELRSWFKANGGRVTYSTYSARERDRVLRAEFTDIDEARYLAAVAATNGYFFRRQHEGSSIDERELFSGGSMSQFDRWKDVASEELQEWFDANGGRLTFNQFKQSRRDNERTARDLHEEEQRRAAEAGGPENTVPVTADDVAPAPSRGGFTADDVTPAPSRGGFTADDVTPAPSRDVESTEDATSRFGSHDKMREFADRADLRPVGDGETVWLDGRRIGHISNVYRSNPNRQPVWNATPFIGLDNDRISRSQSRDTAIANLVVRALQEGPVDPTNPSEDVWRTVTTHLASRTWELPEPPRNDPEARARHDRLTALIDAFRSHRSPSGDLRDDLVQARDDFAWLGGFLPNTMQTERDRSRFTNRSYWAGKLLDGLGDPESDHQRPHGNDSDSDRQRPRGGDQPLGESDAPSPAEPTPDEPVNTLEDTARPPAEPGPETAPEPIGGQPAHWARVEDLSPGDMVRVDGTKKSGQPTQRAGYVYTGPARVEVTRGGRTMEMWRTRVTENPDGTGAALNVYASINATAARAEAPDDVVPGSPTSGAQASLHTGDLPDVIPADGGGSGLFPGSTVRGSDDREGTITGATSSTVSVHWSGGRDEDSVSPTSLTVTDGQRPDGWTADGQRVTPQHIVSDNDGALLGPVDEVDGDNVSITTTSGGTITRSAGDLHVTREVRDDVPAATTVTGIDDTVAADLKEGDVVVLDLDGTASTVVISEMPSRDGDRVTLTYADTTSGEMGELDVDASMVLPRLHGPDGNAPELGPDDAPDTGDDLIVHEPPRRIDPVTGPTIDPSLTMGDLDVIDDHAVGPDDDPDAHQAAVRITDDLPVTPTQAAALAAQLREAADPATPEGRAALRAADHLDEAAGRTPPAGLDRPRPATVAQLAAGDLVALPSERSGGGAARVYRVVDAADAPGGVRSLHLTDENGRGDSRLEHGAMPVWLLPEPTPTPVTPPDIDDTPEAPRTPSTPDTQSTPTLPVAQVRPGDLRVGDVIDAPVSRSGYQFNAHQRLTIISAPQRNGWWMQLTGVDDNGNVHDFGLHSSRAVDIYDRNRPTPALPPLGMPRDPNPTPRNTTDALLRDNVRSLRVRIRGEAIAGTDPAGDIHALREAIAARVAPEALQEIRQAARRDGLTALDASGLTGQDLADARQELRTMSDGAHKEEVRAILRTINDLEPLPDESNEELAARARDLLRLIPQPAGPQGDGDGDADVTRTVNGHVGAAVNTLMQQLQAAGVDPGDAERLARTLLRQLDGSRQATARRIARRVTAASPAAGRQPGLLARIVALLLNLAKRFAELVRVGAQKIAEKYRSARERMQRLRAFLRRLARRARQWPESRRLARLHRAVNLPDADGESLAARISHWAGLMPERGRFGQSQRRVTWWRPTTWRRLASGRLPDRTDRIQWTPDTLADGGPGLTALRHMAALRAAGNDVDQDVTRRLSAALGDDFGDDPHAALQHADDHVAASERRLVNLQGARSGATIPDDPDLEIELTAARAELSAARREYADMRARYAAAVPDAVAAALADIRDMGPEGNAALVFGPDTDPDAERALRGVQRFIPRSWLGTPAVRRLTAVDGDQGRYEPDGQRITVADLADEGMGTAGHALAQHLARHIGDLDAAQRVFWFTSTHTGRPGARRMRRSPLSRLLSRQQTQRDTGDTLARSLQAMFNGDWYLDDDLRAFLLGLMATR